MADQQRNSMPASAPIHGSLARAEGASIVYCKTQGDAGRPGVVFLCGFQSDMQGIKAQTIEKFCRGRNLSSIRFDYQGHGGSSGIPGAGTIGVWLADAIAVLDQLTVGPQLLVGSSMGGWLALLAALARPTRIFGLVLIAPATDFTEALIWRHLDQDQRRRITDQGSIRVPSDYAPEGYLITRELIEDGRRHTILDAPVPLTMPVRILHGMRDTAVPWQHSLQLADRLEGADVRVILLKDGDHRLSRETDLSLLQEAISELSGS
jgi:pimeloyl-ACP methyl ester carboxylesterase